MSEQKMYRVAAPSALIFRDENGEQTVEGMLVPYGMWTEVDSVIEGHFMERFAQRSLRKTFSETFAKLRGYFEHGRDRAFGRTAIMQVQEAWETDEGAFFRASLMRGLPEWMVDGIRRGQYGASIGAEPKVVKRERFPKPSAHNPKGLEERTYQELRAFDISLTPTPMYDMPVMLRSITDELAVEQLVQQPERLLELLRATQEAEPTHSEPEAPEAEVATPPEDPEQTEEVAPEEKPDEDETPPDPEPEGSRDTQPPEIDYLADKEEEEWQL